MSIHVPYQILSTFGNPISDNGKDEVIYYCPECAARRGKPDNDGKFYVNTKTFQYYCFKCGYSGVLGKNIKYDESKIYEDDKDSDLEELAKEAATLSDDNKYCLKIPINKVFTSDNATQYLLKRGFTEEQLEYYDLRVGSLGSEFGRIVIPNEVSRLVYTDYYSARTFLDQTPKYHNPYVKKSSIVFNLHRVNEGSPIIIVEGALTAIAAGHNAVATLGKTITRTQAAMIASKHPSIIYVNYDYNTDKESEAACKLLKQVCPYTKVFNVLMRDERDAADLTHEEYTKCLKQAVEYIPLYDDLEMIIDN